MVERWDAYYKQQQVNQWKQDFINREHEKRRQFGRVLGAAAKGFSEGLRASPQVNCTTTRFGNTAQTVCQ
jgi:hypothetical protein